MAQIRVKMECCEEVLVTEYTTHVTVEKGDFIKVDRCPLCEKEDALAKVLDI